MYIEYIYIYIYIFTLVFYKHDTRETATIALAGPGLYYSPISGSISRCCRVRCFRCT